MCGIAGFIAASSCYARTDLEDIAGRMGERLQHRGPDSSGTWADEVGGVALAHRRLATRELSAEGNQPMHSASGRFVLTLDGEIYNHLALREELLPLGHLFRGCAGAEVFLAAVEQWGVAGALRRSNGAFALALWDRETRLLHLARDRMGEKPLYHGWWNRDFVFGSEIKALREHPAWEEDVDRDALALFARYGHVPAPYCIHEGLEKLEPATLLTVSTSRPGSVAKERYWSHQEAAQRGVLHPFRGTAPEAVSALAALLLDAVGLRMQADVPVGAFLSGGVDSSTVVALMQALTSRPVKTFTIGFDEGPYDEARHARAVARHLATDHTELYVGPKEALAVVPHLHELHDEPFADSSQIPTFLAARLARQRVVVGLSGEGGDELFCGYNRYALGAFWRRIAWIPAPLRALAGRVLEAFPGGAWKWLGLAGTRIPSLARTGGRLLRLRTLEATYRDLVSLWKEPERLVLGAREPSTHLSRVEAWPAGLDPTDRMMFLDALTYLPDGVLVKVDSASMAAGLEARVPLLDHRLVELAWRMPLGLKRRGRLPKWVLRQVLYRYVPKALVDRPKMGFTVPIDSWLRGPLREWAGDLLSRRRLEADGYFDPSLVQAMLDEHLSGRGERQHQLWGVLMFQAWLDGQRAQPAITRTLHIVPPLRPDASQPSAT